MAALHARPPGSPLVYLATAVAFGLALRHIEVMPEFLADTPTQVADPLVRMWPGD